MSKSIKIGIVLLAFVLVAQLFALAAPAAYADGPADAALIGWSVKATDGEGHELTLTTAEEVESALGKGFSVDFGKDASGAPAGALDASHRYSPVAVKSSRLSEEVKTLS